MAAINQDNMDRYALAAKNAGCPPDQFQAFMSRGYVALPKMLQFHMTARLCDDRTNGIDAIMLDGTRGSAKSHAIIAQVCLDDCQRFDNLKFLFLRKTEKAASESFEDLVGRVLRYIPHKANRDRITFQNRSRVTIGGFKDERDIDKYLGIEFDGLVCEEATQISGTKMDMLMGSIRTSREDWVPRVYLSTNPGGVGHAYYKDKFIEPNRKNNETNTRRFFSSYRDNPYINPEYRKYLEGLKGDLAKAWREGDWDIFEGQAFPSWRHELHVIPPFEIPDHWPRWRAIDWGYAAPFCCLWFAMDPDTGRVYVYRELYETRLTPHQQCELIKQYTPPSEKIRFTYADPAMWAKKTYENIVTSTADEYLKFGVPLTKADNDRLSGKRKIDEALANLPDGKPGLQIFATAENLIRTLPLLTYDPINPEDVDTSQEDHGYDALKYGYTNKKISAPKKSTWTPPLRGLKGL